MGVIKWLTSCLLSRQRQTKCPQKKKPLDRLRQSEVFFPLVIVANHVVPPGQFVLVLSAFILIQNHVDFRSSHRHFRVWRTSTLFESPFWFLRNYPLQIKRLPVTERGGYPRPPSMAINTTATLDSFGLLDPLF